MSKTKLRQSNLIAAAFAGLLALALNVTVAAQVPVQESVPAPRGAQAPAGGPMYQPPPSGPGAAAQAADTDVSRLSQLFYQIQVLQQEVQELRGMLEEQSHLLNRLARDQQEQYLDLDRRMQALRGGAAPARAVPGAGEAPPSAVAPAGGGPAAAGGAAPAGEREAYDAAFELMRQRQFQASAAGFSRFIEQYPNSDLTANAYYWLGELHLVLEENEPARQAFAQVVNVFPNHQKVPDALYKLGVVYHRLGDLGRAREFLNRVRNQYPQSSAAGLAQNYLAEL